MELGRTDLAQIGMKSAAKHQKSDGGGHYFDAILLYNWNVATCNGVVQNRQIKKRS